MANEKFDQSGQTVTGPQFNAAGDIHAGHIGDEVDGDKITVGDITGSYAAIGAGAQVIVTQVQQALSAVDEMEKGVRVAERRLAEAIQRLIGHYTGLTAAGADDRSNPYKSLLDYKLEDAPYFYGRAAAIKGSLDKLAQNRLMVLHSESGSGKTSLLQAGLASRLLSAGHFPLYIRPYRTPPGAAVRRALLPDYRTQPDLARFTDEAMSLRGFLERVTFYLGGRRLYLFLDQFEEFFSEVAREDREAFARELQDCVESDLNARWVLSLRKEYFSDLRLFRSLKPYDNEFFLPTFNIREATEVIIEPAARRGVAYEDGLVERIVNDLDQGAAGLSPAQVQLVCTTLFDERRDDASTITHAQYDTPRGRGATGAEGILSSHLSRVLQRELSPPERVVAALALEALVTSEKRRAVKRRDELLAELPPTAEADPAQVLKTLVDSRLLRIDEDDASGEDRYELAHDYLLAEIELDPETQARKAAQELLARELVAYDRYGTLLSKERFAIIDSQRAHLTLDGKALELLTRSERELTRQARRRTAVMGGAAAVFAVLAFLSVVFALRASGAERTAEANLVTATIAQGEAEIAKDEAIESANLAATRQEEAEIAQGEAIESANLAAIKEAEAIESANIAATRQAEAEFQAALTQSQALAVAADAASQNDPILAAQLSIEAEHRAESGLAYAAVHSYASRVTRPETSLPHEYPVWGATWNSDESLVLTWSGDKARVWEAGSETPRQTLAHEGAINGAAWNPDESLILTWSDDETAKIWEVGRDIPRWILAHGGQVNGADWSNDGSLILTWSTYEATVWDAANGTQRQTLAHDNWVYGAAWNADESLILTWSDDGTDGTAMVWELGSETPSQTLVHDGYVNGVTWNANGSLILTWNNDGTARVWEPSSGTLFLTLAHDGPVRGAVWNTDESLILTWSDDRGTKVWDAGSGILLQTLADDSPVSGGTWIADGSHILTWSDDGNARVWEPGSNAPREYLAHNGAVVGAAWNADKSLILTWSDDGNARVWEAGSETPHRTLAHDGAVDGAAWNADGSLILTWSGDGNARVWEVRSDTPRETLAHDRTVSGAVWNNDENLILTWSEDDRAQVWEASSGTLVQTLDHDDWVNGAVWNIDGNNFLTWSNDGKARVWDVGNDTPREILVHDGSVRGAAWNADESLILTWSDDRTARVWEAGSGILLHTLANDSPIRGASWNGDGSLILTWSTNGKAQVWEVDNGTLRQSLPHDDWVNGAVWNADDSLILTWSGHEAIVWDAGSGTPRHTLSHDNWVYDAAWNPDESLILTWNGGGKAQVWDAGIGTLRLTLNHDDWVTGATWNADGNLILTWSGYEATVWDANSGILLQTLLAHENWVTGADWNIDENLILTWSDDGTVVVWDWATGRQVAKQEGDGAAIRSARWNSDESRILIVTNGRHAFIYLTEQEDLLQAACQRLPENITWSNWQRYFSGQPYRCTCPDLPPHPTVLEAPNATIDAASCPLLAEAMSN